VSADGRRVAFYNEAVSGGCIGQYVDIEVEYPSLECFIRGVRCLAEEAHMGGTLIQPAG
jgi:hypothetical protein